VVAKSYAKTPLGKAKGENMAVDHQCDIYTLVYQHSLRSARASWLISPSLTMLSCCNRCTKATNLDFLIGPMDNSRTRIRAGAMGDMGSTTTIFASCRWSIRYLGTIHIDNHAVSRNKCDYCTNLRFCFQHLSCT